MADEKDENVLPVNVKIELSMIVVENCPGTLRTGTRGSTFALEGKDIKKKLLLGLLSMDEQVLSSSFSP